MIRDTWNVYHDFRCIAEKCPDSCCAGWQVDLDEEAVARYRTMDGELGDRLRQVMQTVEGETSMILQEGRCPMWRQDGLCELQAQKGHDALCQVCREYPRLYLDYGDYAEWGLELSCPEAARLIFSEFYAERESVPCAGDAAEDVQYDPDVMHILMQTRRMILVFLEQVDCPVQEALAVVLMYAHQAQELIDGGTDLSFDWQKDRAMAYRYVSTGDVQLLLDFYEDLEILTDAWRERLSKPAAGEWDERIRTLAKYLIRRYWLQAVWDLDLVCRVKFIIASCIMVHALGGDTVQTAQLYSKEIENDPDNREAILDAAYNHPAFTDVNLLSILLKK